MRKSEPYLHYSNCYEDSKTLTDFKKPGTYLSICSGLDNSLALLDDDVKEMIVFDYNEIQIIYAKLKLAAYKYLEYSELLSFLGITEGDNEQLFNKLKPHLEQVVVEYFEKNIDVITTTKLINAGKFEKYLNLFKNKVLPLVESKKTIEQFMNAQTLVSQIDVYEKKWNNFRFSLAFKIFFSKKVMKRLGRDKDYFKYLEKDLASNLKKRLELGFKNVLNKDNCYLQYMIYSKFITLPDYLRLENYSRIKRNLDKIKFVTCSFIDITKLNIKFDYLNLSDIFEYLSDEEMKLSETVLDKITNDQAHIIFWNMMVERHLNSPKFKPLNSDKEYLLERAFLYQKLWRYKKC